MLTHVNPRVFTDPIEHTPYPQRIKPNPYNHTAIAYPVHPERDVTVDYPEIREDGRYAVEGMQNMGRRDRQDMIRNEMPLVKPKTPRLNLTKVNYRHDFFDKDYRVGKKDEADLMGSGYP